MANKTSRRYLEHQRAAILADMERSGLTQAAATEQHGVSKVTIWKWRTGNQPARARRSVRDSVKGSLAAMIRAEVQVRVRALVPEIVRDEVATALRLLR